MKGQYFPILHIHTIRVHCNTHLARILSVNFGGPPEGTCAKEVMVLLVDGRTSRSRSNEENLSHWTCPGRGFGTLSSPHFYFPAALRRGDQHLLPQALPV